MIQSGLIQTDARLNNVTGVLAELPFFDQFDYTEENVDSSRHLGHRQQRCLSDSKAHRQHSVWPIRPSVAFAAEMLSGHETGEDALQRQRSAVTQDQQGHHQQDHQPADWSVRKTALSATA